MHPPQVRDSPTGSPCLTYSKIPANRQSELQRYERLLFALTSGLPGHVAWALRNLLLERPFPLYSAEVPFSFMSFFFT